MEELREMFTSHKSKMSKTTTICKSGTNYFYIVPTELLLRFKKVFLERARC